ncbi:3-deoxy-manno-octulosonate cytidylyltransferase [Coralloluteibacterium stylophorae]|uniref:3-deoxy-manno-octulosonate cytidylyltransferase n=1 Tax=Coralloluteibacterium stylophorae TaxID=1776034 RepID=A0A8J7VTL0_9GAMM|nr:3-deoxy-manno-octulosonate cytidylyltransferase [Coralloluteibacterium stylophorae]MBS7455814.1 3-deoxy-manno-octulosonate cytidylyltransferase [Coralloluteibacterium stylophorae]
MTSTADFIVAIPARHAASRLPGKPLRRIGEDPLVLHVARRALAAGARQVVVATDDARIAEALAGQPVTVCMTDPDLASGSDRIAACADQLGWDEATVVVNLQGDEPFAPPEGIRAVAELLEDAGTEMATLAAPFTDTETLFDPNAVKVVADAQGHALYFSRAPIPWHRDRMAQDQLSPLEPGWLRHIGIYAYRVGFLRRFTALPPARLERLEALEQLRVLEAGYRIAVAPTPVAFPPGVDTPADLERAERHWLEIAAAAPI